jgi:hypothetical protein
MSGHFETVEFYPVPADPNAQSKPAIRKEVNIGGLLGEQDSLALWQDDHTGNQFELFGDTGEVGVGDQRLVEGVGFLIRAGQLRFSAGMNGAEHMIIDDDMIITQIFRCLRKRLDGPGIAAEFDLRINHASLHNSLPL